MARRYGRPGAAFSTTKITDPRPVTTDQVKLAAANLVPFLTHIMGISEEELKGKLGIEGEIKPRICGYDAKTKKFIDVPQDMIDNNSIKIPAEADIRIIIEIANTKKAIDTADAFGENIKVVKSGIKIEDDFLEPGKPIISLEGTAAIANINTYCKAHKITSEKTESVKIKGEHTRKEAERTAVRESGMIRSD